MAGNPPTARASTRPNRRPTLEITPNRHSSEALPPSVQSLSDETLAHTFSLLIHDDNKAIRISAPTCISHVCRRWRRVALLNERLWTNIALAHPLNNGQLLRAAAWLERSGESPLHLCWDFRDPTWDRQEGGHRFGWKHMEYVVRLCLPHVARWGQVEILTDTWAPMYTFLHYTHRVESAPTLRSVSLSRCNAYFASKGTEFEPKALAKPLPLFGGGCDGLRTVRLSGVHVDWSLSRLCDLRVLELKYHASDVMPSLAEFIGLLEASPDLEELTILGCGPRFELEDGGTASTHVDTSDPSKHQRRIHLHRLQKFHFGFIDVDHAVKLLSLFSLHAVEDFSCEDVAAELDPFTSQDASPILDHLAPPHCSRCPGGGGASNACCTLHCPSVASVRVLRLQAVRATAGAFARFWQGCRRVERLSLVGEERCALEALACAASSHAAGGGEGGEGEPLPCPALKTLTCRDVDASALMHAVKARAAAGVPVENATLATRHGVSVLDGQGRRRDDVVVDAGRQGAGRD